MGEQHARGHGFGLTGQGPPIFPRVLSYLAGWGKATVFKDGEVMYEDFGAHFMRVNPTTMQLHVVAHSHQKDPQSVPPFSRFIHFMFDQVTWQ